MLNFTLFYFLFIYLFLLMFCHLFYIPSTVPLLPCLPLPPHYCHPPTSIHLLFLLSIQKRAGLLWTWTWQTLHSMLLRLDRATRLFFHYLLLLAKTFSFFLLIFLEQNVIDKKMDFFLMLCQISLLIIIFPVIILTIVPLQHMCFHNHFAYWEFSYRKGV